MTLDPVAAIPAVAAAAVIFTDSVEAALYRVYLPVLLLLPDGFLWGWFNFHQYAIIPIGLALCWWVINGRWRRSITDVLVFGYVFWMLISNFHANLTNDLLDRVLSPLTLAIFPYMAGKMLIEQTGMRIAIAKRFAFFVFIDSIISVYEFRFSVNPFRHLLAGFFSSVDPWFTQVRYGLGRTSGPFGHAIFMGAIVAIAILLHRYVAHFGQWESRFRWLPKLGMSKSSILLGVLIGGSIMTISRGPWISAVVGLMIATIGTASDRWKAFRRNAILLVAMGSLLYVGGKAYVANATAEGTRGEYGSQEELESAEYRTKLWDEYKPIALQEAFWGWGSNDWPKVPGMASIDNWYLLVMLIYGVTGLTLFCLMLGVPAALLIRAGLFDRGLSDDQRALMFTMCGIIVAIAVAVATVFLGGQLFPLLFLFLGWSDACLSYSRVRSLSYTPDFSFRRVIA